MSAVIWFGIVAVWAFVLIPTWVRRSDIHWRRSGDATSARDKLGHAARVISRSGGRRTAGRAAVPSMRRPVAASSRQASSRRATVAATSRGRAGTVLDVEEISVSEARTESIPAVQVDEPPTTVIPVVLRGERSTLVSSFDARTDLLDDEDDPAADTEASEAVSVAAPSASATAPSAQAADAAETEAPMTNPRPTRPAPRRVNPSTGKAPVPPHVQRARRLVWIGATALATLLLAFVFGGLWIVLHLLADVGLVVYLRHLRTIAKQQLARKARTQTARAEARPQRRAAAPRHRAEAPVRRQAAPQPAPQASAPGVATAEAPQVIDLTDGALGEGPLGDGALSDDCPTTELSVARAV